ncbi:MAG: tRNA lysidine(34) synthetase TilS [Roseiflexaceae bacterium]
MNPFLTDLREFITAQRMIFPGAPVLVAVSGGPDSLCLLHALVQLRDQLGVALHVAHLDHMIRGAESADEAMFVAGLARAWNLPFTVEATDVPALARSQRANLHATARVARYSFLARVARSIGAQAVAVAHHAGDQAETVLLHLLRGAGPEGLSGMRAVVRWEAWAGSENDAEHSQLSILNSQLPRLIRPLLSTTRVAIERYCAEHGLDPRRDPSNFDLGATRNRIRHDLLPRLIEYNPHIIAALTRTADVCAEEHAFVLAALDQVWPQLARERVGAVDIDGTAWHGLPIALQRAAIRRAHAHALASDATLGLEHVEQARALIERGVGGRLVLPGDIALTVGYAKSWTIGAAPAFAGPQLPGDELVLPRVGRVPLGAGWAIELTTALPPSPHPADVWEAYLDSAAIEWPLVARRRRPGDRLRPAGGRGSRRLQDLFVDARVPQALRDAWPIIATPTTIVWVAGLRVAAGYPASPDSQMIIKIRIVQDT